MADAMHRWRLWRRRLRHAFHDIRTFTHPAVKFVVVGTLCVVTLALTVYVVIVK
jgi:hypothetical protein